ncbi:MAG TPA: hypothetical protein VII23_01905 [Terriglobales bacterium]
MKFAKDLINKLQKLLRRRFEPEDPFAYVTADLKRGPGGRSSAVALEEPEPRRVLNLFGRRDAR